MKFFSNLKKTAINFLEPYKTKGPAAYAAAEQAIGAILITDGFIGLENPFGQKKRPGIFGTIGGIVMGIIFMLIPTIVGNISGIKDMTSTTSATVVSVGNNSDSCSLTVNYFIDGREYTKQSSMSSSNYCSLSSGQTININYNPTNPGSWAYEVKMINNIVKIFFLAGLIVLISNIITFFIRLFSIIFGWKLLRDGRKNAANLPPETNLQTMITEIKQSFISLTFGFGGTQSVYTPKTPDQTQGPINPNM